MLFNVHLCNHILLQSGGGTWGTTLYTVRGVGSGSRDIYGGLGALFHIYGIYMAD